MKKIAIIICSFLVIGVFSFNLLGQQASDQEEDPDFEQGEILTNVTIAKFEDAEAWEGQMPLDQGTLLLMKRTGKPAQLPDVDPQTQVENNFVLGAKVKFNKRGTNRFVLKPPKPIKIPGISKSFSIWVVGRNFSHTLFYNINDFYNKPVSIKIGKLNFLGWKKITTVIPPDIAQDEYHYTDSEGLTFSSLHVITNPAEAYGTYYTYFDEMSAYTNVFTQSNVDLDDMVDNW